jgi:hypothetical protein
MSGVGRESAGSTAPFGPEAHLGPQPYEGLSAAARAPSDLADAVRELIDTAEARFHDPAVAWAVILAGIERRRNRRNERGLSGAEEPVSEPVGPSRPGPSTGGAIPSDADAKAKPRRPFVGFDREQATYERRKPELLKTAEGQWVVIVGDELVGPLESDEAAQRAGFRRFGLGPLYIKQVLAEEPPPVVLPWDVVPCQT